MRATAKMPHKGRWIGAESVGPLMREDSPVARWSECGRLGLELRNVCIWRERKREREGFFVGGKLKSEFWKNRWVKFPRVRPWRQKSQGAGVSEPWYWERQR